MPSPTELPLSGPTFDRALVLARQAVTDGILGGPGLLPGLEPFLTEAAGDRELSSVLTLLLISLGSQLAMVASAAELDEPEPEAVADAAVALVEEVAASFASAGA